MAEVSAALARPERTSPHSGAEDPRFAGSVLRVGPLNATSVYYTQPVGLVYTGSTDTIPARVPALVWQGSVAASDTANVFTFDLSLHGWYTFSVPGSGAAYVCRQEDWATVSAAVDAVKLEVHTVTGWRRGQPRITRHDPLVILHWASAPFAGQQLGTNLQPLLPYPDPTVSPTWNAMRYGPGVAQNRVIVPRRVQADYNAAATWVWVLTATGALYSVNVDGSNPVLATFPRLLTNTAAVGAVLTTLVHSVANEAGDTGFIEQYETVAGGVQCWGEFKVQYDAGAWRKWGLIIGGTFFGGTDYIIAQWPNTTGVAASHFTWCRSLARAAQGILWAGGPVGTLADPDQSTPTTPDYYWGNYPTSQGGIFFSATHATRVKQNAAMGITGVARETTLDVHGAPSAVSSGAANGILPLRVGGGGLYSDGFTYIEPVFLGRPGIAGGVIEPASVSQPDGQLAVQSAADVNNSSLHAASAVGQTANVWIGDEDLYYAADANRETRRLLLASVINTGDVVALLTRIGGDDPRLGTDTTITLVCVHGEGNLVQADTITILCAAGVPLDTSVRRGVPFAFPTETYWHPGPDGTGATDSAALSGAYIGPMVSGAYTVPAVDYVALIRADGASSYFPLTESGTTVADLIHGAALALTGAGTAPTPAALTGLPGVPASTAWTFHGGQYLAGAVASLPSGPGRAFTLEAWVQPPVAAAQTGICGWGDGTFDGSTGLLVNPAKRPGLAGNNFDEVYHSALPASGWHHLVVTRSAGGVMTSYLDTVPNPDGPQSDDPQTLINNGFEIGHNPNEGVAFTGSLAHLAVYPLLLTTSQIRAHFRAGVR